MAESMCDPEHGKKDWSWADDKLNEFVMDVINESRFWLGFDLTGKQVQEWINETNMTDLCFDTVERGELANYLAQEITGMGWPMNMTAQDIKDKFWASLKENAPKLGYKLVEDETT